MDNRIEVIAKITLDYIKNDSELYGERLETALATLEKDGVYLEDYSVIHRRSLNDKEMYFNYLMNFALKSDYDLEDPSPLSFAEWKSTRI